MPRQPRVFVEGGLYHVYNRAAHGAEVFAEGEAGREFAKSLAEGLGVGLEELTERTRRLEVAGLRFLVVGLGIERWGQRASHLAQLFGRRPDLVSWWAKKARALRLGDPDWGTR